MDKIEAAELIRKQRERWPSDGPDDFIARRAERAYQKMAKVFAVLGAVEAAVAAGLKLRWFYLCAGGFLIGGAFLYRQSRRFAKVRSALRDSR